LVNKPIYKIRILFIAGSVALLGLFSSCSNDEVLASVNDHELTESDARTLMSNLGYDVTKSEDMVVFVDKWVDAMMMQDELTESDEQMDRVAEFRSELFRGELSKYFLTEKELLKSLDSTATDKELQAYYQKHKDEFELQDFIVKALFIKLPLNTPKLDEIKEAYLLKNDKDIARIESYTKLYAEDFYFDDENWIFFQEIRKKMPARSMNSGNIVLNRTKTYFSDDEFIYFINVLDYKLKSESPPFDFIKEQIRERLIGQRMNARRTETEKKISERLKNKHDIKINL
jgi:hypothetical protein